MKKEKKVVKKIPYLDYACRVGERVQWKTIVGEKYEGTITAWNENVAVVSADDGSEHRIPC
jgi:hypothetical protein